MKDLSHVEFFASIRTGEILRIRCGCDVDHDHTYVEWLSLPANELLQGRVMRRYAEVTILGSDGIAKVGSSAAALLHLAGQG